MNHSIPEKLPRLRLLLIEDDEDDFILVRDLLEDFRESRPEIEWIPDPDLGLETARKDQHDVILVDYRLGRWSGLELIEQIRKSGARSPLILLTGEGRDNLDIEALQKGAADYLAKAEIDSRLLERSIRYAIERKRSEEALRESEKRLRTLADAVPVLIWMNDGCPYSNTFLNQCWLDFRGKTLEEELPDGWMTGVHPDDLGKLLEIVTSAIEKQKPFQMEFRLRRHDGEYRWMYNTGTCLSLSNGKSSGYVGSCIDITDRKRSAEQLAKARDEALEHARLKSQFLANMTHEIRTPMNGILGMTGLLQQTDLTDEQRDLAESVHSSGRALVRIIDDILDFSRLEAGKLQIDQVPFNLLPVLEDVIELFTESARTRGLELISFTDPETPLALIGDAGRIRQILLNLVGNAIKFTGEGEVHLQTALLREDAEKAEIRFEIRDTGVGISPETENVLFTPFMQADGSTTRTYGGTGLGLAICKELIDLMNGKISVKSEPGVGSRFEVRLAFTKDSDSVLNLEAGKPSWKGEKILVIDDNSTQRALLCRHLVFLGFDCIELSHPAGAAQILRRENQNNSPFAAIFIEADQPSGEAEEIISRLANLPDRKQIPIIAMPFDSLNEELEPLSAAGADFFLPKPIRQSQIHPLLETILDQKQNPAPNPPADPGFPPLKNFRFLIISDRDPKSPPIEKLLHSLDTEIDLAKTAQKAIQLLALFHYDAIFIDRSLPPEESNHFFRQLKKKQSAESQKNIPVITIGEHSLPGTIRNLPELFEAADLKAILRACQILPGEKTTNPSDRSEQSSPKSKTETLNLKRLREIIDLEIDGEDVIGDLLRLFRKEVPKRVHDLQNAVKQNRTEEILFLAHSISGICTNLGAIRMEKLCDQLKNLAPGFEQTKSGRLLNKISEEMDAIEAALQKARKTIQPDRR